MCCPAGRSRSSTCRDRRVQEVDRPPFGPTRRSRHWGQDGLVTRERASNWLSHRRPLGGGRRSGRPGQRGWRRSHLADTGSGLDDRPSDRPPALDRRTDRPVLRGPDRIRGYRIISADQGDLAAADRGRCRGRARPLPGAELLATWRTGRASCSTPWPMCRPAPGWTWIGPPMGAGTMASARIMETWAHGQDIADALGVVGCRPTGFGMSPSSASGPRDHAFRVQVCPYPLRPFRVELTAPSGAQWYGGPTMRRTASPVRRWTSPCW